MTTRRQFLTAAAGAICLPLTGLRRNRCVWDAVDEAPKVTTRLGKLGYGYKDTLDWLWSQCDWSTGFGESWKDWKDICESDLGFVENHGLVAHHIAWYTHTTKKNIFLLPVKEPSLFFLHIEPVAMPNATFLDFFHGVVDLRHTCRAAHRNCFRDMHFVISGRHVPGCCVLAIQRLEPVSFVRWPGHETLFSNQAPNLAGPNQVPPAPG